MLDKCIRALRKRPATRAAVIAAMMLAPALQAQSSIRSATPLRAAPSGRELATLHPGAAVRAAAVRQGHTQVTIDGFVDGSLLGSGRDSFPTVVKAPRGARLRSAARPDAAILADLRDGMGVTVISRTGDWVRVRRTGWVSSSALGRAAAPSRAATPPAPADRGGRAGTAGTSTTGTQVPRSAAADSADRPVRPPSPPAAPGALMPTATIEVRVGPNGQPIARVDSGAHLTPLARDDGWTRVRIEGWVRDGDVVPADTALRLSLSAADIRAAPESSRGALVRWDIQFIAVQRADQLRRDLRVGEPYVLARGPGSETGLLYFAVPPSLLAEVERFEPLETLTVTARVRVGRSEPVGIPVLDLISAARK